METNCKVLEVIAEFGKDKRGNTKKLIKAEWFGKTPIYELRAFSPDGTPMRRVGLKPEELLQLRKALNEMDM